MTIFTVVILFTVISKGLISKHSEALALETAIKTSSRPEILHQLLRETHRDYRDEMEFLITNMLAADRDTMQVDLLLENVEYAHLARNKYTWARSLPEEVYFTYVLPYHVVDEVRDSWRKELYELFSAVVDTCATMEQAVTAINASIPLITGVEYNTLREKTNQSPRESMRQGMASCTGLSILLVDAFRSIGIPARFVGTASWHDNRGNHSWTEVWMDGKWRVTEYYFPNGLDQLWFMADAAKADPNDRNYAIYATRFGQAADWFPMVWCAKEESDPIDSLPRYIGAENVTQHYIDLAHEQQRHRTEAGTHTLLRIAGYAKQETTLHSTDRAVIGVDVFAGTVQMGGGLTASPRQDMNDMFTLLVPKNAAYELRYANGSGEQQRLTVNVADTPVTINIYLE